MDRWVTPYIADGLCAVSANVLTAAERFFPQFVMRAALRTTIGLCASIAVQPVLDSYIRTESVIAKAGLLANIGPGRSQCSSGAKPGIVIASPNTVDPDYCFNWLRDASLVFQVVIDEFTASQDPSLGHLIEDFVTAEARIQQTDNLCGNVSTGGLGDAKFLIDGQPFTGPWGRPQRDGPALRSSALITYANWFLERGNDTYVKSRLWPIIKLDLDYVVKYWNETTYDLWEELFASSFWTTAVQHKALRQGVALAKAIGETTLSDTYAAQAGSVLCFMQSYWNPSGSYMTSNTRGGRTGVDANTVLASIHTFDPDAGCDAATFQPCSDKALASLKVYVDSFRSIYSINRNIMPDQAVATGRYAEDVYIGGNPWYLSTSAVAQQLYDALMVWDKQRSLTVTGTSLSFFRQFGPVQPGTYDSSTPTFGTLTSQIKSYADGFLSIMAKYTPQDGHLAEQFGRDDGKPLSAVDLTWSYAAALTAFAARNDTRTPTSWGAKGLVVPAVCRGYDGPTAQVTFKVVAHTVWGENIFITGSAAALGDWSPDGALPLSAEDYPTWKATINITTSTKIQYKYIRKFNGQVTWEGGPDNQFITPLSGSANVQDEWRW